MRPMFVWRGKRRVADEPGGRRMPRKDPPWKPCVRVRDDVYRVLNRAAHEQGVTVKQLVSWLLRGLPPAPRPSSGRMSREGRKAQR